MKVNKKIIRNIFSAIIVVASAIFSAVAQGNEPEKMYAVADQRPLYLDGESALLATISQYINYPEEAIRDEIQGTVLVGFIIDKDGVLSDPKVKKAIGGGCDEEAIRVAKLLQRWQPAQINGKAVNYKYVLPIRFKLPQ